MHRCSVAGLVLGIALSCAALSGHARAATPEDLRKAAAIDGARIEKADSEPGNWLSNGRTYSEQRFSPLSKIDKTNVAKLGLGWWHDMQSTRGLEATPIVVDGVMYLTGTWSIVHALDARTGKALWTYDPAVPAKWGRYACCDVVNRGVAVWKGKVYVGTLDGRLVALDAGTGKPVWSVQTFDQSKPYTITGAPRVVKGKVIIGNGGAEYGVRGYVTAYDAETGTQAWRFYTVPGDPSKPFEHPEMKEAAKTWKGGEWWKIGGGGTAWDGMAYDPELNLLYVGTGNGSPWIRELRSPGGGDNLYLSSILALDADTGRLKWHYQTTPGDTWDFTATQPIMLADLKIDGKARKVLMQAPKNGFFYVLDRATGELLSAKAYTELNWALGVDMKTGRPIENAELDYSDGKEKVIKPAPPGGHNWHPMSFNPKTGLVYIPVHSWGFPYKYDTHHSYKPVPGWWNLGVDLDRLTELTAYADHEKLSGYLVAWDPVKAEPRWTVEFPGARNGGTLTTAGDLVFMGAADGTFSAFDAASGERVWSVQTGVGIIAAPVTYELDGEQYVSVLAGYGGGVIAGQYDPASAIAKYLNEGRLLTFKIGGGPVPQPTPRDTSFPEPPPLTASAETIEKGAKAYGRVCMFCHGAGAISSLVVPDLRRISDETRDHLEDIVLHGAYEGRGMPNFSDLLNADDVAAIRAYLIKRTHDARAKDEPTN
jgi:quinohemoprotein ethanol dehydrogenase